MGLTPLLLAVVVLMGSPMQAVGKAPSPVLQELRAMAQADQAVRLSGDSDPEADDVRQKRVLSLLAEGKIQDAEAKECAALILQHSGLTFCEGALKAISVDNFLLAHLLAKGAVEQGRDSARWLAAASLDRYLVFSGKPQKYGTQTVLDPKSNKMVVPPIDPVTTDEERARWHVEPLAIFLKRTSAP